MALKSQKIKRLSLEGEAGADLVGSLVQVLGIKGSTEAEGNTRAEQDVVSQSGNTAVVDLGLYCEKIASLVVYLKPYRPYERGKHTLAKEEGSRRYLLATSRPTALPEVESQEALAPAST
jgi:hypothetical protein